MTMFPSPFFRLFTVLESLPCSRIKYFVQGHIESLRHSREIIAGVRPPCHLLVTLFHHPNHNPTTRKIFPGNYTGQTYQWKEWLFLKKGRGSSKMLLVPAYLTPLSFSHTVPFLPHLAVIPFYFGQIFYHPFIYIWLLERALLACCGNTHTLRGPKARQGCSGALGQRSQSAWCWLSPGLCPHLAPRLFVQLCSSSTEIPQSTAATEAGATWPRAVPNVTKGILPRLSLRWLGNHLLAQNNSHVCCSSASCSYLLSQSSFLLCPDNSSYCRILPGNADTCEDTGWIQVEGEHQITCIQSSSIPQY